MKKVISTLVVLSLIFLLFETPILVQANNNQATVKTQATVKASVLNVRNSPSTSAAIMAKVKKGAIYDVSKTNGNWVQITVNKKKGWVSKKYVTLRTIKVPTQTETKNTVSKKDEVAIVKVATLNVRSGAGTKYSVVSKIKKGQSYEVLATKGTWVQLQVNKKKGWVSKQYITIQTKKAPSAPSDSITNEKQEAFVTASSLNVRSGAGTKYAVIASVKKGTRHDVVSSKNDWVQIKVNKNNGWVNKQYVQLQAVNEDAAEPEKTEETENENAQKDLALLGKHVVIDPGHGGKDVGAVSSDITTYEKVLNLQLSLLLREFLENYGATVTMTREADTYLTLQQRVNISNARKPDAFISLHHDAETTRTAKGYTIYYYHSNHFTLAKAVENAMQKDVTTKNRGSKYANFQVLRNSQYPAILLEAGFMSNNSELSILKDKTSQNIMVQSVTKGLVNYLK